MKIILYYGPIACSLVPYVTLTEAGADFEVRTVNLGKGQQMSPEYLKLNPKHKVPVLVIDGRTLTENVAMHQWVHQTFPQARILPSDPWQYLQAVSLMAWCSSGIHPFLTRINNPAKVCDVPGTADAVVKAARENLFENFQIADELLAGREYFFDHFTAPDAHFFWTFRRAQQFKLDVSPFKNCVAHYARMQTRPSVQKVLAFEKETLANFAKAA
jgi:glutathione S-transferase